ncbi:hypothetical protein [Mesorhizobium sp. IMUNJ 23232]
MDAEAQEGRPIGFCRDEAALLGRQLCDDGAVINLGHAEEFSGKTAGR